MQLTRRPRKARSRTSLFLLSRNAASHSHCTAVRFHLSAIRFRSTTFRSRVADVPFRVTALRSHLTALHFRQATLRYRLATIEFPDLRSSLPPSSQISTVQDRIDRWLRSGCIGANMSREEPGSLLHQTCGRPAQNRERRQRRLRRRLRAQPRSRPTEGDMRGSLTYSRLSAG